MEVLGEQVSEDRISEAKTHLAAFRTKLIEFAEKHRSRIQKDPEFRAQFVAMCEGVGVDFLRSAKSFWTDLFGIGSFYSDLAVQILTLCLGLRKQFGGLVPLTVCMQNLQIDGAQISVDDVKRAVSSLACLGAGGVRIISFGPDLFISSLPHDMYGAEVLGCFSSAGPLTTDQISARLNWSSSRSLHAIRALVKEGEVWVERTEADEPEEKYWLLSLWS